MRCPNCGTENQFGAVNCAVCGCFLEDAQQQTVQQPQTNQQYQQPYQQQPAYQQAPQMQQNSQPIYSQEQFVSPVYNGNVQGNAYQQIPVIEQPKSGIIDDYKKFWKNYANFNSRARRSEYWHVFLINALIGIVLSIITSILGAAMGTSSYDVTSSGVSAGVTGVATIPSIISFIYSLATFIPGLALAVRRLHDVGKSGTYILMSLIPFVGWIFILIEMLRDSEKMQNQYGPSPKYTTMQ